MRVLVTGGAGFIGSACVVEALKRGWSVTALDAFDETLYARARKEANIAWIEAHGEIRLIEGDVRDDAILQELFAHGDFDVVLHLAALAGVRPSIRLAPTYFDVNVTGTMRLMKHARAQGARRFVLASSSSVYGSNEKTPFAEDDPVHEPASPYAASKLAMEIAARTDWSLHGGDVTCLRFFTVYGPRQRPEMAIHKFMRLMAHGAPVPMFGDGTTGRDYTFIDDIVDGVFRAIERPDGFALYNLGGDRVVTLRSIIEAIAAVVGVEATVDTLPMQPGDVTLTSADLTRSRAALGYAPQTPLEDGLAKMWAWFTSTQKKYDR
ncbi:MAG: SDR family NAD(P)-dependent oxidoreductase [Myxococcota bacterium]